MFYPDDDDSSFDAEPAKRVCRRCLVRPECLGFAMSVHETAGVWGGLTPGQRRAVGRVGRTGRTHPGTTGSVHLG